MVKRAMLDGRDLTSHVQRIVERFGASCRAAASTRQVRDLSDELVLELLAALRTAPLSEIATVVASLERGRPARVARIAAEAASASAHGKRAEARGNAGSERNGEAPMSGRAAVKSRDPFDITMPGELLDSTHGEQRRDEELPPTSGTRSRAVRREGTRTRSRTPQAGQPPSQESAPPAEARPPAVSLREGEQLVRSSGAGVVIRRARSA